MKIPTNSVPSLYFWLSYNSITQWLIDHYPGKYQNYTGWVVRSEDPSLSYCNKHNRSFYYYSNGLAHREDGPALIRLNGAFSYYYEGKNFSEQDYYKIPKVMMNVMNQIVNEP